jgi:hypothetical protein
MVVSSAGLRPKSDCSGKAQKQLKSKLQTRPLVREGDTKQQTRRCLKEISRRKKNWSNVPDGRLTPRQTGRLTVDRKLTSTSTSVVVERRVILSGLCLCYFQYSSSLLSTYVCHFLHFGMNNILRGAICNML